MKESALSFENVKITTLDNGLRIATDYQPGELVTGGIWNGVGARYETKKQNGLVHKKEHVVFKGTPTRTDKQILNQIENGGGRTNAETCAEHTSYYIQSIKDTALEQFDIVSDMFWKPTFPKKEFAIETKVILLEIQDTNDDFEDLTNVLSQSTVFGDHPLGRPILGSSQSVKAITPDDIYAFMHEHYCFDKMLICASGAIEHDALVDAAIKKFQKPLCEKPSYYQPAHYIGGTAMKVKQSEQVNINLSFKGVSNNDPLFYPAEALSVIMGSCMSSRLYQEIREKRGLAYEISSASFNFSDAGYFSIQCSTDPISAQKKVLPVICEEIQKACGSFTDEEINRAKKQLLLQTFLNADGNFARTEKIAEDLLFLGHIEDIEETKAAINAIDRTSLDQAAKQIFSSQPTYVAVGPVKKLPSYNHICDWLKP